ncbi:MAG: DUF1460 domain-containing protein [Burkholderiales bacterium]|nr:DUF1460 domain-containing protein [Burkholderiales bacterium]
MHMTTMVCAAARCLFLTALAVAVFAAAGCAHVSRDTARELPRAAISLTPAQILAATTVGMSVEALTTLIDKPLYRMKPEEVGHYLAYLRRAEPDLRARVVHLGRKNIGQPYELYLLGEFPYETVDDQPLFSLEKSDCVVFAEHTYAMALAESWEDFFWLLQRIRYRDGVIGVVTRNHYTETDWNPQNAWLFTEISAGLAGERAATYPLTVDRSRFLRNRYKLDRAIAVQTTTEAYVPNAIVAEVLPQLQQGDLVNIISGKAGGYWASHVGMVVIGPDGARNLLHSSEPAVREESFDSFMQRARDREARNAAAGIDGQVLAGFKFLRLHDNPVVPPMAPQPRPMAVNLERN